MRSFTLTVLILAASICALAQGDPFRRQLLPTGKLRVGLNAGNPLTSRVGTDIGHHLAQQLGAEVIFIEYPTPGAVTDAVGREWDIAFVAADPERMAAIAFTPPYVELDATYLVRSDSHIQSIADVDRPGVTIATAATAAYTLVLKRDIRRATLVFLSSDEALTGLQAGTVTAIAGLRDTLLRSASRVPGSQVLTDNITRAQQAIAVPKENAAALAYLTSYLADLKQSGFIADAVRKTGVAGASVVP